MTSTLTALGAAADRSEKVGSRLLLGLRVLRVLGFIGCLGLFVF